MTCYNITSNRPSHAFQIRATAATWWNTYAIAACENLSVKCASFEEKTILFEFQIGAPATSISINDSTIIIGLKTGRCEVWTISEEMKSKKIGECIVGKGASPILSAQWVFTSCIALI